MDKRRLTKEQIDAIKARILIDPEDADLLDGPGLHITDKGYAALRWMRDDGSGRQQKVLIHRLILKRMFGENIQWADHVRGNRLDIRRSQLRQVTPSQNAQNRKTVPNKYGYTGVSKTGNTWFATIKIGRKRKYLGAFPSAEAAGRAYAAAAETLFGEFLRPGVIQNGIRYATNV